MPQSHLKARKNPDYWDKSKPVVDAIEIKIIPDEASIIAQLRTGNIHHAMLEDNKNYLLVKDDKRLKALRRRGSASTSWSSTTGGSRSTTSVCARRSVWPSIGTRCCRSPRPG